VRGAWLEGLGALKSSQFMDLLLAALRAGKLCVVDVSQMRTGQALVLSGLILRRIFDHNQAEFTAAEPRTIPTIAVVEEAQAVLNERATAAEPYIAWVKEGRKYDLGALLITQQPGSIPVEILRQGDNWFIFHLLSGSDLGNVRSANAHFSNDLLSVLLNEPIPGQGVFWSSVGGKPYPVSVRVLPFERMYGLRDPDYNQPAAETYARTLRDEFDTILREAGVEVQEELELVSSGSRAAGAGREDGDGSLAPQVDPLVAFKRKAIDALRDDEELMEKLRDGGVAWGTLKAFFIDHLPQTLDDRDSLAYRLVGEALTEILGVQDEAWYSFRNPDRGNTTYVRAGRNPDR